MKRTKAATLIAELEKLDVIQQRIDRVAKDLESKERRYAAIDAWKLGELLEVDLDDSTRTHWGYCWHNDDDEDDDEVHYSSEGVSTGTVTLVSSFDGLPVDFEVVYDADGPCGLYSPYDLEDGKGFDSSDYVALR